MRNNNGASIRKLSNRSLQNNRMRNLFAILAIALTCTLFTVAFSLTSGTIQAIQEDTMREVGSRGHAGLKHVTTEQYEKISADEMVEHSYYNILIGVADNILKTSAELRFAPDEGVLEDMFITLEEGHLPIERNEIVINTFIMNEYKIPYALGEKVPIRFMFMGQEIEEEFTVSGWYKGDNIAHASECFLSESFWNELKGTLTEEDFIKWGKEHPNQEDVGLVAATLTFHNSSDIEEKVRSVIQNAGYEPGEEVAYGVNWAYMSSRTGSVDPMTLALLISAVIVTLITGYLIIYNIFRISVIGDIRFYGLLKTIGTTKKQLRRLIRRQAVMLSAISIPIGLITGFGISRAILPSALAAYRNGQNTTSSLTLNPWIFLFGAGFSILTVFLSCRKPGKIAGSVSPIEAVKYTESAGLKPKKKKKRNNRFSPLSMALSNLGRNKRTTTVVISSISLSIVLLALIITAVRCFSLDEFIAQRITGDFLLGNISITTASHFGPPTIDPDYLAMADSQEGIKAKNEMYTRYGAYIQINEKAIERYRILDAEGKLRRDEFSTAALEKMMNGEKSMNGYFYGYNTDLLSHLKIIAGNLDVEKFLTGDYVLLSTFNGNDNLMPTDHVYAPGDIITVEFVTENSTFREITDESGETIDIEYDNLTPKEYEVMAIVDIPYSLNTHRYMPNVCDAILPLSELTGNIECFAVSYEIADEYLADFETAVKNYTENDNPQMGYLSGASLQSEFNGMIFAISVIGISLACIIALIGILNFINAMLTEIISRKREFALLQSIGMTNVQLQKILIYEGVCYIIVAAVTSLILGSLLSYGVLNALNKIVMFFEYRFQILPFIIMTPLLFIVAIVTPLLAYRKIRSKSIVERLRETES